MKIKPKQYAEALYASVKDASQVQAASVIEKFAQAVVDYNQVSQLEKIIDCFISIWNKDRGIMEVEITSARELDKGAKKLLRDYATGLSGAKSLEITEKVDQTLIGGAVIKFGDRIIDSSLRNRLNEFRKITTTL